MQNVRNAATALGGKLCGNQILCPGPGHSRQDLSLCVTLDPAAPDGFLVHSFANDDWRECRDYVKAALGIVSGTITPAPLPKRPAIDNTSRDRIKAARAIWAQTRPIHDTPAEAHLRARGCLLDDIPDDLRFHAELRYQCGTVCGLVAAMRDIQTNEITGIHRTFLTADGQKIDRKMLGIAKRAVVKLTPDAEVTHGLGICEGVETGLSIMRAGFRPMWACLSAGAVASFPVLSGIESLTIFADHDESRTGEIAASRCARRWLDAGCEVQPIMPAHAGDYNDEVAA